MDGLVTKRHSLAIGPSIPHRDMTYLVTLLASERKVVCMMYGTRRAKSMNMVVIETGARARVRVV
jgi:hypothetical protein